MLNKAYDNLTRVSLNTIEKSCAFSSSPNDEADSKASVKKSKLNWAGSLNHWKFIRIQVWSGFRVDYSSWLDKHLSQSAKHAILTIN